MARKTGYMHQLLRNHALTLPDDEELLDELANARLRETTPGVYRLDHDPDQHDDRAIALALAASELTSAPVPQADAEGASGVVRLAPSGKPTTTVTAGTPAETTLRATVHQRADTLH